MSYNTRPHTNWLCSCGSKLLYRSRHIERKGSLMRYYLCSNSACTLMWKGVEKLQFFKDRGEKK